MGSSILSNIAFACPVDRNISPALEDTLKRGKLDYAIVKGEKTTTTYNGYKYRRFDISKGTIP